MFLRSPSQADDVGSQLPEEDWVQMEELLVAYYKRPRSRVHSSHVFSRSTDNSIAPVCVVHEPLRVECVLVNPLASPLELQHLSLWCVHNNTPVTTPKDLLSSDVLPDRAFDAKVIAQLTIPGGHRVAVNFTVTPLQEGPLDIKGLEFNLAPGVHGVREFKVRGRRLNSTLKERTSVMHAPDFRLQPVVTTPMPQLAARILVEEPRVMAGQLVKAWMELSNSSGAGMVNLTVTCSRSEIVVFGHAEEEGDVVPMGTEPGAGSAYVLHERPGPGNSASGDDGHALTFAGVARTAPSVVPLLPSRRGQLSAHTSVRIPVWILPQEPGTLPLHFIFYFEAATAVQKMPYRLLRHSMSLTVLPGLSLSPRVFAAPHVFDEYIISLRAENQHNLGKIRVEGIACMHKSWGVHSLRNIAAVEPDSAWIAPLGAYNLHVGLTHRGPSSDSSSEGGLPNLDSSSTVPTLVMHSSSNALFTTAADVNILNSQPFAEFYARALSSSSGLWNDREVCLLVEWMGSTDPDTVERASSVSGMVLVNLLVPGGTPKPPLMPAPSSASGPASLLFGGPGSPAASGPTVAGGIGGIGPGSTSSPDAAVLLHHASTHRHHFAEKP